MFMFVAVVCVALYLHGQFHATQLMEVAVIAFVSLLMFLTFAPARLVSRLAPVLIPAALLIATPYICLTSIFSKAPFQIAFPKACRRTPVPSLGMVGCKRSLVRVLHFFASKPVSDLARKGVRTIFDK
jgi:hypothetical protein